MGTPRMGNQHFASIVGASAKNCVVLANTRDPVPHTARIFGARHVVPIHEIFMDPIYFVGLRSGDVDVNYAKHMRYNLHSSDASFARSARVLETNDHMTYFIGLDEMDLVTCGGMSDYYVKNTKASHLFG